MITLKTGFLPSSISDQFRSLDGADVAAWLASQGYKVLFHEDTGRNGEAVTACGWVVSTNGYCHRA